jgi:transposase
MTSENELPRDVDALLALIGKERAARDAERELRETERESLLAKVASLEHRVQVLSRWAFGPRSEKRVVETPPAGPQALFNFMLPREEAQRLADKTGAHGTVSLEAPAPDAAAKKARKPAARRVEFPAHLPHVRTEIELPAEKRICCDVAMEPMGFESTKVLERVESTVVHEIARTKYCCRKCQMNVVTAPLPTRALGRTLLGNSFLASLAIERFQNHMSYHRLEQKYASEGLDLDRSVLCRSSIALAELFAPVMPALAEEVLSEGVAFADETTVTFQEAPSTSERAKGWMWVYANKSGDCVFDINESRGKDSPSRMLANFGGYLHVDGYAVYPAVVDPEKVQIVACWAHARRGFVDAASSERKLANEAVEKIGKLFELEKRGAELAAPELQKLRSEHAPPLLDDFRAWCESTLPKAYPAGPLADAIKYCFARWDELCRYVTDGRLELSNNKAERFIRPFAVGRKNWNFVGNENGGRAAAVFYSLISTCKSRGIDARDYIFDAMLRLAEGESPAHLTPCEWQRRHAAELEDLRRYVSASVVLQAGR